jgi:hypothetical protein
MRDSPRRTFARPALAAFSLLAMSACTPLLDLSNRPGPCDGTGLVLCESTGLCLPSPPASASTDAGAVDNSGQPWFCPAGFTVRQGDTIMLAVPVASLDQITRADTASDLVVSPPQRQADGSIVLPVSAPHGLVAGDGDFGPKRRFVNIDTLVDQKPVTRQVLVTVSNITVGIGGDDRNTGTLTKPYATIARAAAVAEAGDTIDLVNLNGTSESAVPVPCSAPAGSVLSLKAGVTMVGHEFSQPTMLPMGVVLGGDATFDGVQFGGARLVIDKPGSAVALHNVKLQCGVTISTAASVIPTPNVAGTDMSAGARVTSLSVSGGNVWNDLSAESPIIVEATGASVTLSDNVNVVITSKQANVETIRFAGDSGRLTILSGAQVANSNGNAALNLLRSSIVYLENANISGSLLIADSGSSVQIKSSHFSLGADVGAIQFFGHDMQVSATDFAADGIVQNNPNSVVTVDGMSARGWLHFGYRLTQGQVMITNSDFSHAVKAPDFSANGPWALVVDAPTTSGGVVTSRSTTYDVATPLTPCVVRRGQLLGLYSITNDPSDIAFY